MKNPYPELAEAQDRIAEAEYAFQRALEQMFPVGTPVRINHPRGSYLAKVVGVQAWDCRLLVENLRTGAQSYAYPGHRLGIHEGAAPCVEKVVLS